MCSITIDRVDVIRHLGKGRRTVQKTISVNAQTKAVADGLQEKMDLPSKDELLRRALALLALAQSMQEEGGSLVIERKGKDGVMEYQKIQLY